MHDTLCLNVFTLCREIVPQEEYQEVQLHDCDGQLCGCSKLVKNTNVTLCKVHGPKPHQGTLQFVTALRRRYTGRVLLEVPGWSHLPAGRRQGRKKSGDGAGQLCSGKDMGHDIVIERYTGAIYSPVVVGAESPDVVGVEMNGPDHKQNPKIQSRDAAKVVAAPFTVVSVAWGKKKKAPPIDDDFWDEEVDKVLSKWPEY